MTYTIKTSKYCVARYFTRRERFYAPGEEPKRYTRMHSVQEVEVFADSPTEAIALAAPIMDADLKTPAGNPVYKVKCLGCWSMPLEDHEKGKLAFTQINASREQPLLVSMGRLP